MYGSCQHPYPMGPPSIAHGVERGGFLGCCEVSEGRDHVPLHSPSPTETTPALYIQQVFDVL